MDLPAVTAAFDRQLRRDAPAEPGTTVERDTRVVRQVAADGWSGVVWSDLTEADADAVIAAQVARFAGTGRPWEWKHYSYDRPADLPERLRAAGFRAGTPEAVLVAEAAAIEPCPPPAGVRLVPVTDRAGAEAMVRVHDAVFGGDFAAVGRAVLAALSTRPPPVAAVVAMAGDVPVSAARVEFPAGTDFAGLWGGGTLPEWRGRGVFRALVAHRAALARERGVRYLQVDAMPESLPILRRLGFVELATTTPYLLTGPDTGR